MSPRILAVAVLLVALVSLAPSASASTTLDIRGDWAEQSHYGGTSSYVMHWKTEDFASGAVSGTGGQPGADQWSMSGTISGNHLVFTETYYGLGYTSTEDVTVAADGNSYSGTFHDSNNVMGTITASRTSGPPSGGGTTPPPVANDTPVLLPQVCGPSGTILPPCELPVSPLEVCGPMLGLANACQPKEPGIMACGGLGTILPLCNLPPPQLPHVCGPSNTILPPCSGANNPITVCGPSGTILPECNFGFKINAKPIFPDDGQPDQLVLDLGCPADATAAGAQAAATKKKRKTCPIGVAIEAQRSALEDALKGHAASVGLAFAAEAKRRSTFYHDYTGAGIANDEVFQLRAGDLITQYLAPNTNLAVDTAVLERHLLTRSDSLGTYAGPPIIYSSQEIKDAVHSFVFAFKSAVDSYHRFQRTAGKSTASAAALAAPKIGKPAFSKRIKVRTRGKRKARVRVKLPRKLVKALRKQATGSKRKKTVPIRLMVSYRNKRLKRPVVKVVDFKLTLKPGKPKRKR